MRPAPMRWSALQSDAARALEETGLATAGSLRRARVMLDEAKDVRADMALDRQRQQATSQRVDEIELRIATLSERRAQRARASRPRPMRPCEIWPHAQTS